MKNLSLILFFIFSSGCAIAPLSTDLTAQSYGKGSLAFSAGMSTLFIPDFKVGVGVTENWDIWGAFDFISLGVGTRYSFINNERGFSLAGAFGAGTSMGGRYFYIAPIFSYRGEKFEPYLVTRYNYSDVDEDDYDIILDEIFRPTNSSVTDLDFAYGQIALGTRYWFTRTAYFGFEANVFLVSDSDFEFINEVTGSVFIGGVLKD